ncbi:MAG: response regulator, partial [Nitrospira sp.]|nr:response regulator [Nitrospira sp.]
PRMDGTALCQAIRSSKRPHTPIIVVTSMGDPEEKRKALAAGADAYIIKADFEQGHFLDLVARLTGKDTS